MTYEEIRKLYDNETCYPFSYEIDTKIGFHKVTTSNLHIQSIDPDKISSHFYYADSNNYALADDGMPFTKIHIHRTDYFNEFKARGIKNQFADDWEERAKCIYSPNDPLKLYDASELKTHLSTACDFLSNKYGLTIEHEASKIYCCEIAKQFTLSKPLTEYARVFFILKSLNLNSSKIDFTRSDTGINKWESCVFSKPSWELYVYDKSKELYEKRGIILSDNLIKLELRIPYSYCYKVFKEPIKDLEDTTYQNYYRKCVNSALIIPFNKWKKNYMHNLNELVSEYRSTYKYWCTELLLRCNDDEHKGIIRLLDYHDILNCPCIKELPYNKQHRIKKNLENKAKNTIYDFYYSELLYEIIDKISSTKTSATQIIKSNKKLQEKKAL